MFPLVVALEQASVDFARERVFTMGKPPVALEMTFNIQDTNMTEFLLEDTMGSRQT